MSNRHHRLCPVCSGNNCHPNWEEWTRRKKAIFLLHGRYAYDSAPDMSYFFYTYCTDAIKEFAREAYELVKSVRSNVVISAAVFKNPQTSGRFIRQRWTDWTECVDECCFSWMLEHHGREPW